MHNTPAPSELLNAHWLAKYLYKGEKHKIIVLQFTGKNMSMEEANQLSLFASCFDISTMLELIRFLFHPPLKN